MNHNEQVLPDDLDLWDDDWCKNYDKEEQDRIDDDN